MMLELPAAVQSQNFNLHLIVCHTTENLPVLLRIFLTNLINSLQLSFIPQKQKKKSE